jgi:CheY-like chemotaxis protein/two-component sensor histidine kinase
VIAREREARSKAEGASRAKDEFLAMLGHELRNPLNAITAAVALLERVPPGSEHAKRSYDIVARQARHLTDLVEDLLDVARVTSGKIVLERRTVDLGAVVRRSVDALESSGRLAQHRVEVSTQAVHVSADETRLEQIATNLLENAVKYTPAGKAIRVRVEGEDREAVLEVSDEGEGLAPDLLPRVFELFTQGERTLDRAQGGLGLGLTLVKSLVGLHDGRVSAHSEGVGRGARFVVRLPRAAAPEKAPVRAAMPPEAEKSRRVLLVEDNADSAETLRTLLEMRGHAVSVAGDGPAGVAAGSKAPPEIALIDIGLPGFDGFEVARRLRAAPGGDAIRLVALTGYGQADDRKAASEAGFDAFLVKPVDIDALHGLFANL